jgi:hypothetical protein
LAHPGVSFGQLPLSQIEAGTSVFEFGHQNEKGFEQGTIPE